MVPIAPWPIVHVHLQPAALPPRLASPSVAELAFTVDFPKLNLVRRSDHLFGIFDGTMWATVRERVRPIGAVPSQRVVQNRSARRDRPGSSGTPLTWRLRLQSDVRPLLMDSVPSDIVLHVAVLVVYACAAYYVALVLTRRRLLR